MGKKLKKIAAARLGLDSDPARPLVKEQELKKPFFEGGL